jgi:hypothetical protein
MPLEEDIGIRSQQSQGSRRREPVSEKPGRTTVSIPDLIIFNT